LQIFCASSGFPRDCKGFYCRPSQMACEKVFVSRSVALEHRLWCCAVFPALPVLRFLYFPVLRIFAAFGFPNAASMPSLGFARMRALYFLYLNLCENISFEPRVPDRTDAAGAKTPAGRKD